MDNKQQIKIIEEIFSDKDKVKRIIKCQKKEEIEDIFIDKKIELTDDLFNNIKKFLDKLVEECKKMSKEDLNKIICKCKEIKQEGLDKIICKYKDLKEEDLENIVGGFDDVAFACISGFSLTGAMFAACFAPLFIEPEDSDEKVTSIIVGSSLVGAAIGGIMGCGMTKLMKDYYDALGYCYK